MRYALVTGAVALCLLGSGSIQAASLRIAPTILSLIAPDSAATLTLRNEDARPVNVQMRVFRWSQDDGADRLEPTTDVVASPPLTTLAPNSDYLVRVVRVTKAPVVGEESYRLLVDELPERAKRRPGTVNFVLRYSIPVFFSNPEASPADVSWALRPRGKAAVLTAKNTGDRHLRISDLNIADGDRAIAARDGLVGYVLSGASMQWPLSLAGGNLVAGRSVALSAQSDAGAINATLVVPSGR